MASIVKPGTLTEMAIKGIQNMHLTGGFNRITFFRHKWRQHTPFACELSTDSKTLSGNVIKHELGHVADLVRNVYLMVHLPALRAEIDVSQSSPVFMLDDSCQPCLLNDLTAYGVAGAADGDKLNASLIDKKIARASWRKTNYGGPTMLSSADRTTQRTYVYEQGGGILAAAGNNSGHPGLLVSHDEGPTHESMLMSSEELHAAGGKRGLGTSDATNFQRAQDQLLRAYGNTAPSATFTATETDDTTIPVTATAGTLGETLRPYPFNDAVNSTNVADDASPRTLPTEYEKQAVANYVYANLVTNASAQASATSLDWSYDDTDVSGQELLNPGNCAGVQGQVKGEAEAHARWVQGVGYRMIEEASLHIGNTSVVTLTGDFMFVYEELTHGVKRLREMVGNYDTREEMIEFSRFKQVLYVPLSFWFTKSFSTCLPLVALSFNRAVVKVKLRTPKDLIVVNDAMVKVHFNNSSSASNGEFDSSFSFYIAVEHVYLAEEERDLISDGDGMKDANGDTIHLCEQLQVYGGDSGQQLTAQESRHQVDFNHTIKYLLWFIRRPCNVVDPYNFSGIDGRPPQATCELRLNGNSRFGGTDADLHPEIEYRQVMAHRMWPNLPQRHIYSFCFAIDPSHIQPSGCLNGSRLTSMQFTIGLQQGLNAENPNLHLMAVNYNLLTIRAGTAGALYNS